MRVYNIHTLQKLDNRMYVRIHYSLCIFGLPNALGGYDETAEDMATHLKVCTFIRIVH